MGIFEKLFHKVKMNKDPDSPAFRREMAKSVAGMHIKYVTEKKNNVDEVVGRDGNLGIHNGEFIVHASEKTVFRCPLEELQIWELLSKDGVVLTGPDLEHGGIERTVIAYYVYYRK